MYVPAHFALSHEQSLAVLAQAPAGDLVTNTPDGLAATLVPLVLDPENPGRLIGHLSRVNDQWRPALEAAQPALFIAHGPDAFVDSQWLSTPDSPSVGTWNYLSVQVWGQLRAHSDPDWIRIALERLCLARGDASLERVGPEAVAKMLPAVVGVELEIERILGKAKMSQNRTPAVITQVIDGLEAGGQGPTATWMRTNSLPRAEAKAAQLAALRDTHRQRG